MILLLVGLGVFLLLSLIFFLKPPKDLPSLKEELDRQGEDE